jgi:hypothetical protein
MPITQTKMPNYPKITSKKIKYKSPSGYAVIGKYVPPFEKNTTGFGFKGVALEDFKSGKLQCSICGEWFEQLPIHLFHAHDITSPDYKRKFGLLQSTALKSKKMRLAQSVVMQKMRNSHPKHRMKFKNNNLFAGNRKGIVKAEESKNKFGVCDLQVMEKVIELHNELGKTPTLTDLKDRYGAGFIFQLHKRYSSYINYCNSIGFEPNFSNYNPKYSREYFIEKALSNEPSLRIMTTNESRAFYRYFDGGIRELRKEVEKTKLLEN